MREKEELMNNLKYILFFLFINSLLFPIGEITAPSIGLNGANCSVATGFDAIKYNPSGLLLGNAKKIGFMPATGMHFAFGNNSFSTYNLYQAITAGDLEDYTDPNGTTYNLKNKLLDQIPPWGMVSSMEMTFFNTMVYFKKNINGQNLAFGVGFIPTFYTSIVLDKKLFTIPFKEFDLTEKLTFNNSLTAVFYFDQINSFCFDIPRLAHLMRGENFYIGGGFHLYLGVFMLNAALEEFSIDPAPGSKGLYDYELGGSGTVRMAGFEAIKAAGGNGNDKTAEIFNSMGGFSAGPGFDIGATFVLNRYFTFGTSFMDFGFIIFPNVARYDQFNFDAKKYSIEKLTSEELSGDDISEDFNNANVSKEEYYIYRMPGTFRFGAKYNPIPILMIAADIGLSNIMRFDREPIAFFIATGLEFAPKLSIFKFPLRVGFQYNTKANYPSLAFGLGFHAGVLRFDLGIRGIEFLLDQVGTRDLAFITEFKVEI